ncbi:hypothetical protein B0H11DRAFT_2094169 [Mycena galericulata]|nr:hypothetical protein B0H11DRAFT_2094169 [Mycena galericulata]
MGGSWVGAIIWRLFILGSVLWADWWLYTFDDAIYVFQQTTSHARVKRGNPGSGCLSATTMTRYSSGSSPEH